MKYLNIRGSKSDIIHVTNYDEQKDLLLSSGPVSIDFYFLAVKTNVNIKRSNEEISDSYLYFDGPGNVIEWDVAPPVSGYSIAVSADLLYKFAKDYNFVNYNNHEALFLTKEEEVTIEDLFTKAHQKYKKEKFSKDVLVSYASLILSYTQIFYERQFETRSKIYNKVVANFYQHLERYFNETKEIDELPSVHYFARKANLSTNYFGDLIRHFTGNSPQQHIHQYIIQIAKNKLRQSDLTVGEIAYSLGFEYPTYFTRFFKKETGITPRIFRNQ
ncbi:MAG: AraC family transcriptional regulator [Chitinophagaceae bacterium]|nr:AraC family transcriptional regulator [Chitinophagaceae bacterium]